MLYKILFLCYSVVRIKSYYTEESTMAYIRYIIKDNGFEYASIADSKREGEHVSQGYLGNLGRVIDKSLGIFKNRERGLFCYSIESGYSDLPED